MDLPDFLTHSIDGEIRIRGHRLRLIDVARLYDEGHAPEAIVLDHFPTLTLAEVHKTIAFFLENRDEVRRLIRENDEAMARLEAMTPRKGPTLEELQQRMAARRRAEAQ
jgi:uncharacterized protein (DUF433 family)